MKEEYKIRHGNGVRWKMVSHTCAGTRETTGFTIDNLDTKKIEEATSLYEKVFINVREVLASCESMCLDNEEERMQTCQKISDSLRPLIKGVGS